MTETPPPTAIHTKSNQGCPRDYGFGTLHLCGEPGELPTVPHLVLMEVYVADIVKGFFLLELISVWFSSRALALCFRRLSCSDTEPRPRKLRRKGILVPDRGRDGQAEVTGGRWWLNSKLRAHILKRKQEAKMENLKYQ